MSWSPASGRDEIETALRRLGGRPDREIDIAEAALLLAALDRPRVPLERYRHHLSLLGRDTADLARDGKAGSLMGRIAALNAVIRERYGYRGDELTYDDPQNANLMRVIDRRKGLPIALGILYLHAARAQGWAAEGLNFPGHFLLRLDCAGERAILDPFHGGVTRAPPELRELLRAHAGGEAELRPEHTAPAANRDLLLRLRNNVKLRLLRGDRVAEALEVLETMLMIAPDRAALWHEAGVLNAHLENLRAAVMALENALALEASDAERHQAAALLQRLCARLH
jgi:regulator of sirC expression with transglutaminase-like and TPR domain